jgi:hypothetical protein
MAPLPDLHVSDSSEAMLSGRKPPFRLLVKCVHSDGRRINIRHAVSEGFVVRHTACWLRPQPLVVLNLVRSTLLEATPSAFTLQLVELTAADMLS